MREEEEDPRPTCFFPSILIVMSEKQSCPSIKVGSGRNPLMEEQRLMGLCCFTGKEKKKNGNEKKTEEEQKKEEKRRKNT